MTNSNLNLDSKKPIEGFTKSVNNENVFSQILVGSQVDSEPLNIFDKNIFKQTESYLDWDIDVNKENTINNFYVNDTNEESYEDTEIEPYKQVTGIGVDIGGGLALDKATAGLLVAPFPGARPLYFGINFFGGVGINIAAQKARGEKNIDWGEAIQSGAYQMIPFGSTAKGAKGLRRAAVQGAVTSVAGEQIRKGINEGEFLSLEEILKAGGLGGGLGITFKGTLDALENITKKYAGKTIQEINTTITEKEKNQITKAIEETNQFKKDLNKKQNVKKKTKKKKQDLGDKTQTPQQYTNKGVKGSFQEGIDQTIIELKGKNAFSGTKSQQETKLKGLGLYDERVLDIKNTKRLRAMALKYIEFYGEQPPEELAYALAQAVVLASDNTVNVNTKFVNALNSGDFKSIKKVGNELDDALQKVEEWLTLDIKAVRTPAGRVMRTFQEKPESGLAGKSVDEVMDMTPAQKRMASENIPESTLDFDEAIEQKQNFRKLLNDRIEEAEKSGDFTRLYKLANTIKQTEGSVEKMVALKKKDIFIDLVLQKAPRVFNEIGINGLLSAPTTQAVNLTSGVAQSYLSSLKLALGSNNLRELEAAKRHLFSLNENLRFGLTAFKKSWDMEDNFVNLGNYKGETGQRFAISSDADNFVGKAVDKTGKVIRVPQRLMTSTDAMVQAPNIIASSEYLAFNEGLRLGYKGDKLNKYVKGQVDAILEHFAENGKTELKGATAKILKRAREFSKTITFTQDIRAGNLDVLGHGAKYINKLANNQPLARTYFSFTKAPTNIIKSNARLIYPLNAPNLGLPLIPTPDGGRLDLNPLSSLFLPEIREDLLSTNPIIAQQTRGEIRLGMGLGLVIFERAMTYKNKLRDEEYIPPIILTGGGPAWNTQEGAAMWKAQWKNGWRPYSYGVLQKDENGDPLFGEDGEPVYVYSTLENRWWLPEPLAGYLRLMVDLANSHGVIKDKPYDDFTVGWVGAISRFVFDRSYTTQISELLGIMEAVPKVGQGDRDLIDNDINYKAKKGSEYFGKFLTARGFGLTPQGIPYILPYANLSTRLKQAPADILELMGFTDTEIQRFKQKVDTKVRAGDAIDQNLDIDDPNYNKHMAMQRVLGDIINQSQEKFIGKNFDLPFMEEHATGDPVLYAQREGLDFISTNRYSKSKNYKYYSAQKLIGRLLPEPREIITGDLDKDDAVVKKLNTYEYNQMKTVINRVQLDLDGFGAKTLIEAQNEYLNSAAYEQQKFVIEQSDTIKSGPGKVAAEEIYRRMSRINRAYILAGERLYYQKVVGDQEKMQRIDKKNKIKEEYGELLQLFPNN